MREILFRGKPVNKAFGDKFIYGSLGVIREGLMAIRKVKYYVNICRYRCAVIGNIYDNPELLRSDTE